MKASYLPKKFCGESSPEVEIEFLDAGDLLQYWDERSGQNRFGTVQSVGPKFIHVITAHKLRKIRRDSEGLKLKTDKETYNIVGNR